MSAMAKLVEVLAGGSCSEKQTSVGNYRIDSVLVSSRWTRPERDESDDVGGEDDKTYVSVFGT